MTGKQSPGDVQNQLNKRAGVEEKGEGTSRKKRSPSNQSFGKEKRGKTQEGCCGKKQDSLKVAKKEITRVGEKGGPKRGKE